MAGKEKRRDSLDILKKTWQKYLAETLKMLTFVLPKRAKEVLKHTNKRVGKSNKEMKLPGSRRGLGY